MKLHWLTYDIIFISWNMVIGPLSFDTTKMVRSWNIEGGDIRLFQGQFATTSRSGDYRAPVRLGIQVPVAIDHQVCLLQQVSGMGTGDGDTGHARLLGRLDTIHGVFKGNTFRRLHS